MQLSGHDPRAYGETVGSVYDQLYSDAALQTDEAVAMLAGLASRRGSSRAILEFGIGTGRLALPLQERGFRVAGIEASPVMVAQLREKPGGAALDIVVGDFTDASAGGEFAVVALTFNAIFGLPNRDAQIAAFHNAARHIEPGGCFVIEAYVLRPEQMGGGWSILPRLVEEEHVELQLARYDAATQRVDRTLVHVHPEGTRVLPVTDVYAWPGELDLMARAAGLRLRSRRGGWRDEPFDASSSKHVSIYERFEA